MYYSRNKSVQKIRKMFFGATYFLVAFKVYFYVTIVTFLEQKNRKHSDTLHDIVVVQFTYTTDFSQT